MSDRLPEAASERPPNLPSEPAGKAVAGFFVDVAIAVVVLLATSLLAGVGWAAWQAIHTNGYGKALPDGAGAGGGIASMDGIALIVMTLFTTGLAALVPYFWRRRATAQERAASLAAIRQPRNWAWILLAGSLVLAISNGLMWLGQWLGQAPRPSNLVPMQQALAANPWLVTAFVVLLAPMYEELLFRRVLFGRLWAAGRPWLGMLLSSIAFALMHEIPGLSANSAGATALLLCGYGLMGAVFAWVYWRTSSLWASIIAHGLNNAVALAVLLMPATGMG